MQLYRAVHGVHIECLAYMEQRNGSFHFKDTPLPLWQLLGSSGGLLRCFQFPIPLIVGLFKGTPYTDNCVVTRVVWPHQPGQRGHGHEHGYWLDDVHQFF